MISLLNADARAIPLPDGCVNCVVTSPPYWGLRDYGVAGQIGLEDSLEGYLAEMVAVFREVRRVLRDDGTLWLNLGDGYAAPGAGSPGDATRHFHSMAESSKARNFGMTLPLGAHRAGRGVDLPFKPKDLMGIPWRVAFALQADGWYLRRDIIWQKSNPMPESVTDRPTTAHEYVFLLAKSERYYYDREAAREPVTGNSHSRGQGVNPKSRLFPMGWQWRPGSHAGPGGRYQRRPRQNESFSKAISGMLATESRNLRSVWTIPTRGYAGAHFATFPPALVEPCVRIGCPAGGLVFDPFAGSGTTLLVARQLGRNAIGLDLSAEYIRLARRRLELDRVEAWSSGSALVPVEDDEEVLPLFQSLEG